MSEEPFGALLKIKVIKNKVRKGRTMKKDTWKAVIQIVITILTAISSSVLVQSCGLTV